jgi:hypothetical protein
VHRLYLIHSISPSNPFILSPLLKLESKMPSKKKGFTPKTTSGQVRVELPAPSEQVSQSAVKLGQLDNCTKESPGPSLGPGLDSNKHTLAEKVLSQGQRTGNGVEGRDDETVQDRNELLKLIQVLASENEHLEKALKDKVATASELQDEIGSLQKQLKDVYMERNEFHTQLKDLKKYKATYVKKYETERHEKVEAKKKIRELQAENSALEEKLQDQRESFGMRLAEQEAGFAKAQKAMSDLTKRNASNAWTDEVVRAKFVELKQAWGDWSRQYCVPSLHGIAPSYLQNVVDRGAPVPLRGRPKDVLFRSFTGLSAAPRLLLDIVLSHDLVVEIFDHPFEFLEESADGISHATSLKAVHNRVLLSK